MATESVSCSSAYKRPVYMQPQPTSEIWKCLTCPGVRHQSCVFTFLLGFLPFHAPACLLQPFVMLLLVPSALALASVKRKKAAMLLGLSRYTTTKGTSRGRNLRWREFVTYVRTTKFLAEARHTLHSLINDEITLLMTKYS